MTSTFLANSLFIMIAFSWMMYLAQELFVSGSSALNLALSKTEEDRKAIQEATGLHWDGIEVWLIAAMVVTLGSFPLAFATSFTVLYVVFFLLLYALITRGIVIETLYKLDNPKWVKYNAIAWAISSAFILFFFGVYITSLFDGLPLVDGELDGGFLSIISVTTLAGGLFVFSLGIVGGGAWIALTTNQTLQQRAFQLIKKSGLFVMVAVFLLLIYMGINVRDDNMFVGELFSSSALFFVFPALTVIAAFLVMYFAWKEEPKWLFISSIATMVLFVVTGFLGSYPNLVPSTVDAASSITISDAITQVASGRIIFFTVLFAYPVIIGYQVWKYRYFWRKSEVEEG
jgi:cytochrome d ubiquinol oxidase subunit II